MKTYISLFSSAGVGCYGFKEHFTCVATNELIKDRLDVQRANKKCKYESGYIQGDITNPNTQDLLYQEIEFWKQNEGIEDIDVVFATPPCQGMSTANYKKTEDEQVRNSLVVEAIKIVKRIQPKVFVFENVRAFLHTTCTDVSGEDMPISESIHKNLSGEYHIYSKVINFKDYGVPSSRPRTIVIGTLKSLRNISPLNIFPVRQSEITLREAIGDLSPLKYGEKDATDFLHFARKFPEHQIPWISNLKEGESAFKNPFETRPHKFDKDGNRVELKGEYMGNKYRRLFWDKPCACIATRNDQLASQDTIHPTDNRVLSIRELMRLMTIPDTFQWSNEDSTTTPANSDKYLNDNELNIRRCIGEAVPTRIIADIAKRISTMLDYQAFVEQYDHKKVFEYAANEEYRKNFYIDTFIEEQLLENTKENGAFYTPQGVVYDAIKDYSFDKESIRVLEPSVGLGAFLPQISALLSHVDNVYIDAVEINPATIVNLRNSLQKIDLGANVHINFIESDFLLFEPEETYDVIFTNPPYGITRSKYPAVLGTEHKTNNLYALFLIKLHSLADDIMCVIPKNFVMASEFESIRHLYQSRKLVSICDFGVKFFKKVFVEIVSIHFSKNYKGDLTVVDYINERVYTHKQGYIYHDRVWLIYRDEFFDKYISDMQLDIFTCFRDRQITNSHLKSTGKIWVIKSKNVLDNGDIVHIDGYDKYIDDATPFAVSQYMNTGCIIMPNFTYNTRATFLPNNVIPNGSIALLFPSVLITNEQIQMYATEEFRKYYAIVKSYSKFTLNIDKCSLYYIGIK